jgi:hypothetical protein
MMSAQSHDIQYLSAGRSLRLKVEAVLAIAKEAAQVACNEQQTVALSHALDILAEAAAEFDTATAGRVWTPVADASQRGEPS